MRAAAATLALALVAGCGGDNGTGTGGNAPKPDMTIVHDMASVCGHPGDTGNSLGVGQYCTKITDCTANTKATLCTTLGSDNAYFCTFACSGPTSTECGETATCQCSGGQCGCFPDRCK